MSTTTIAVKATRRRTGRSVIRIPDADRTVVVYGDDVNVDDRAALDEAIAMNNAATWRDYDLEVVEVTVDEAPAPPPTLPTEPGLYLERDGATRDVWELKADGTWRLATGNHVGCKPGNHRPERYLPFTRLVPEATS